MRLLYNENRPADDNGSEDSLRVDTAMYLLTSISGIVMMNDTRSGKAFLKYARNHHIFDILKKSILYLILSETVALYAM